MAHKSELSQAVYALGIQAVATFKGEQEKPEWNGQRVRVFEVTLKRGHSKSMTVPFFQGMAHTKAPSAADVLSCLLSDASVEDATSFEDWCSDFGYDTDSRQAEKTYRDCLFQTKELRAFLGEHFDTLRGKEH
jgi:hypothetical protein